MSRDCVQVEDDDIYGDSSNDTKDANGGEDNTENKTGEEDNTDNST
jgi:hypothetical protein